MILSIKEKKLFYPQSGISEELVFFTSVSLLQRYKKQELAGLQNYFKSDKKINYEIERIYRNKPKRLIIPIVTNLGKLIVFTKPPYFTVIIERFESGFLWTSQNYYSQKQQARYVKKRISELSDEKNLIRVNFSSLLGYGGNKEENEFMSCFATSKASFELYI